MSDDDLGQSLEDLRNGANGLLDALTQRLAEVEHRRLEVDRQREAIRREREEWERTRAAQEAELWDERSRIDAERATLEEELRRMAEPQARRSDILKLNIGGEKIVQRRRSTLCAAETSFLTSRFSGRWEQMDRDEDGNYFINYSPELFMPVLDYLGMRETAAPGTHVPFPQGPAHARPQFEAMLHFFDLMPQQIIFDAIRVPYESCTAANSNSDRGFAFSIEAKARSVAVLALETCASENSQELPVSIYAWQELHVFDVWQKVAEGVLLPCRPSRIAFSEPLLLRANTTHRLLIEGCASSTDNFVVYIGGNAVIENDDLKILSGCSSRDAGDATAVWPMESGHFNGKVEYTLRA